MLLWLFSFTARNILNIIYMTPFQININIQLDASNNLLAALQALTGRPSQPSVERPNPQKVETKPAPAPEVKQPEVAPANEEISDEALRALIKETRTATSPAAVRNLFNEFGIKTSIECPMDRRPDLVARLRNLK